MGKTKKLPSFFCLQEKLNKEDLPHGLKGFRTIFSTVKICPYHGAWL